MVGLDITFNAASLWYLGVRKSMELLTSLESSWTQDRPDVNALRWATWEKQALGGHVALFSHLFSKQHTFWYPVGLGQVWVAGSIASLRPLPGSPCNSLSWTTEGLPEDRHSQEGRDGSSPGQLHRERGPWSSRWCLWKLIWGRGSHLMVCYPPGSLLLAFFLLGQGDHLHVI